MKRGSKKEFSENKNSAFPSDMLAMMPKKVAAAIRDVPLSVAREKLPEELALYLQKITQKLGTHLVSDISQTFSHLKNCGTDFPSAVLHGNPTFAATLPIVLRRSDAEKSEQIGSGVVIKISGQTFLLTAAHVADFKSDGLLMIPGREEFFSPSGIYTTMNMPVSGSREDDKFDVAYICLDNNSASGLHSSCKILEHEDLYLGEDSPRRYFYTFIGFPWRKTKVKDGEIATDLTSMTSTEIHESEYAALGLNRSQHLVIQFNRKRTFSERNKRVETFPSPSGMSGGGVYMWSEDALKTQPIRLPLAGIANEFIPEKGLLIATRLRIYLRCIFHSHPELFKVISG
jgi:hypothetical protein